MIGRCGSYNPCMRIAIAQINPTVGDMDGNLRRVLADIAAARAAGCDLVAFPELTLCGSPPQDLLWRTGFVAAIEQATRRAVEESDGITVVLGTVRSAPQSVATDAHPSNPSACLATEDTLLYNSAIVARSRRIVAEHPKMKLPGFDIFSEPRYFTPGQAADACPLERDLGTLDVSVGEDFWIDKRSTGKRTALGGRWIINIAASPYVVGKPAIRRAIAERRACDNGIGVVYVNCVGGQDDLVFDGGSFVIGADGRTLFQAPRFEEGLFVVELDPRPSDGPSPKPATAPGDLEEIRNALLLGIRDYTRKNGFARVLLGLSGGIDSAVTAALAAEALGPESVIAAYLPSRYSARDSAKAAQQIAAGLGIELVEISIAELHNAVARAMPIAPSGLVDENIQPRLRGVLLMALANQRQALVLCPANKAEIAVGYSTLYGDTVGALAPIGDLYKHQVIALAHMYPQIPESVIRRPPTAELRAGQRDDEDLPSYEILDPLLSALIEENHSRQQLIASGFAPATVDEILRRYYVTEYKRSQLPPAIKVSAKAFGSGRRFPVTHGFRA